MKHLINIGIITVIYGAGSLVLDNYFAGWMLGGIAYSIIYARINKK